MSKKVIYIAMLLLGFAALVAGMLFLQGESVKAVSGTCLGIGSALLSLSTVNLLLQSWYKKHPEACKQSEIDCKDERNTWIRCKAKAKCADILQWLVIGLAWITILVGAPLWLTLLVVGVFVMKSVLEFYFIIKYEKEM